MINVYCRSERNKRETNQDRYTSLRISNVNFRSEIHILAVSDGMGGMSDGERFAELALSVFQSYIAKAVACAEQEWKNRITHENKDKTADELLIDRIENESDALFAALNREVTAQAREMGLERGGATLSACVVIGHTLLCLNTGDSAIYLIHSDGSAEELGVRDNAAEYMLREGIIEDRSCEDYRKNENALMMFLGKSQESQTQYHSGMHCRKYKLTSGDTVIIASDGAMGNVVSSDMLKNVISPKQSMSIMCRNLFKNAAQVTGDNQTAVFFRYFAKKTAFDMLLPWKK